jgi:hypothetical protein
LQEIANEGNATAANEKRRRDGRRSLATFMTLAEAPSRLSLRRRA